MIVLPAGKPPESLLISLFLFMQSRKAVIRRSFCSFLDWGPCSCSESSPGSGCSSVVFLQGADRPWWEGAEGNRGKRLCWCPAQAQQPAGPRTEGLVHFTGFRLLI